MELNRWNEGEEVFNPIEIRKK